MAEYKTHKTGPGIVIFAAIVALIFLTIVVGKFSLFSKDRIVTFYLDSVSGVKERTAVVYAGRKCGEVRNIRILQPNESKTLVLFKDESATQMKTNHYYVEIKARLDADTPINQDTKVSIMMVGMLGDKTVDLAPGDPAAPPLGPNDALYGENAGMERLVTTGRKLVVKLEAMMENIQTLLTQVNGIVKDPKFQDDLKGTVANARSTLEKAGATLAQAREMLGENRDNIKGTLANARELTDKSKTTIATLNDTLGDTRPRLKGTLDNVQQLTADLRPKLANVADKASATLGKAHDTLDNANGLLADNRQNITLLLTNLREMGYNTKQFTHTMRLVFAPWSAFNDQKSADKKVEARGKVKVPADNATNAPPAEIVADPKKEDVAPTSAPSATTGAPQTPNPELGTKPTTPPSDK